MDLLGMALGKLMALIFESNLINLIFLNGLLIVEIRAAIGRKLYENMIRVEVLVQVVDYLYEEAMDYAIECEEFYQESMPSLIDLFVKSAFRNNISVLRGYAENHAEAMFRVRCTLSDQQELSTYKIIYKKLFDDVICLMVQVVETRLRCQPARSWYTQVL